MMKRQWSQAGFSIVQGLILASALATMALVGTQYITQQKEAAKSSETRDSIEQVHLMISSILTNRSHCFATLNRNGIINVTPNSQVNLTGIYLDDGSSTSPAAFSTTGRYVNDNIRIESLIYTLPADLSHPGELAVNYVRLDGTRKGYGGENISKRIPITLQRSDETTPSGCSAVLLEDAANGIAGNDGLHEQLCQEFGLTVWDSEFRTCKLKDNMCDPGKVFTGIDDDGQMICKDFIEFLPVLVSNQTQSCPDDFDLIKLSRVHTTPYNMALECNKTGFTCPSEFRREWTVMPGPSSCWVNIPRGEVGQTITLTDDSTQESPGTGTATFRCDGIKWIEEPGSTCIAPCGTKNVTWKTHCSGTLSYTHNGHTMTLTDDTLPSLGSATYKCVNGVWSTNPLAGATCTLPCQPATASWSVGGESCKGPLPLTQDGQFAMAVDSNNSLDGTTGQMNWQCVSGNWVAKTPKTCTFTGAGGQCNWTGEISWTVPGCLGFQSPANPVNGSQWVKNQAKCTDLCNTCTGNITKTGCTYIPN